MSEYLKFMKWEKKIQLVEVRVEEFVLVGYFMRDNFVLNNFNFLNGIYMNIDIPGSLTWEIDPTYQQSQRTIFLELTDNLVR